MLILAISGALHTYGPTALEAYRETQRKSFPLLDHLLRITHVGIDKNLDALSAKVEEFLAIILLLFFGQPIFGLRDLELSTSVQSYETHAQVGPACMIGVRSLIRCVTDTERAHLGRVPDICQSHDHSAIQIQKWGS